MKYALLLLGCFCIAQNSPNAKRQLDYADFESVHGNLTVLPLSKEIAGEVTFDLRLIKKTDTISIDAVAMEVSGLTINGKDRPFVNTGRKIQLYDGLKRGKNKIAFRYTANPRQTLYFVDAPGASDQVWTQGQGKYTSHWFPSFDDVNEKMVFSLSVTYSDPTATVISNGVLKSKGSSPKGTTWNYAMEKPMSSYLLMLAIGNFEQKSITATSGIVSELYLEPQDVASKWEDTYRHSREMFDFLESELIPYPWQIYRQIPVRDFLYGGMENTTSTLFTRDYVVDSIGFNDRNYVNVNAHELAHQWFGDLITAQSGEHHWLQEGFATYYALLAEKEVFGEDYFYWKLYENAEVIQQASRNDSIPILNAKASSVTFYQKAAWALHILRETVGADHFRTAVRNYLKKYQFTNVDTDDFLDEVEKVERFDREAFVNRWLKNPKFEVADAIESLSKNAAMRSYFRIGEMGQMPFADRRQELMNVLASDAYFPVKAEAVYQTMEVPFEEKQEVLRAALATGNIEVRQAVARSFRKIPEDFRTEYESLLDDDSYITREIALNALCRDFPDKRFGYLDKTDNQTGLNDKNIRLLWLTLALKTDGYRTDKKVSYYDELLNYAQPGEEASVRQSALQKLLFINRSDTNVFPLLAKALVHHKWQLTKFARDTIREKLKLTNTRKFFEDLLPSLSEPEQVQLKRLLDEK